MISGMTTGSMEEVEIVVAKESLQGVGEAECMYESEEEEGDDGDDGDDEAEDEEVDEKEEKTCGDD